MAAEQAQPISGSDGSGLSPAFAAVRVRLGLVLALFALAAIGWWWIVGQMQGMDDGPWTSLGTFGWFLGVWVVMMAAMMFPSVAPTVALYSRMTKTRLPLAPAAFTAGYLLTWAAAVRSVAPATQRPARSQPSTSPAIAPPARAMANAATPAAPHVTR